MEMFLLTVGILTLAITFCALTFLSCIYFIIGIILKKQHNPFSNLLFILSGISLLILIMWLYRFFSPLI